ncbi:MAG: hypothetical protein IPK94_08375 [Saprospiraceae bacterium]|nr:hypothetical protein [Saprospiraceae bacterium]
MKSKICIARCDVFYTPVHSGFDSIKAFVLSFEIRHQSDRYPPNTTLCPIHDPVKSAARSIKLFPFLALFDKITTTGIDQPRGGTNLLLKRLKMSTGKKRFCER